MPVRLYTRAGCHLCDEAAAALASLSAAHPHTLVCVDIDSDEALRRRYGWLVPVVVVASCWTLVTRVDRALLADALTQAEANGITL